MTIALRGTLTAVIAGIALAGSPAAAEEAKAAISASMLLEIVSAPGPSRATDFDRWLRDPGPAPAPSLVDQLVSDGTARVGATTITVKNPCPPGTAHYEPPPLPARRLGN